MKTRETPDNSIMDRVIDVLEAAFPDRVWDDFSSDLIARGFYNSSISDQFKAYVRHAVELSGRKVDKVFSAFLDAPDDKLHALAAETAYFVWHQEPSKALARLKKTAKKPGSWAKTWSAIMLHRMVSSHSAETILDFVRTWTTEGDEELGRLVIMGFRPRLPMAPLCRELAEKPGILRNFIEPLLETTSTGMQDALVQLLGDIGKDNPAILLDWCESWLAAVQVAKAGLSPTAMKLRKDLLSQSLRTLVEGGNPRALDVLGYKSDVAVSATWLEGLPEALAKNEVYQIRAALSSPGTSQDVLVHLSLAHAEHPDEAQIFQAWAGSLKSGAEQKIQVQVHFTDTPRQEKQRGPWVLKLLVNGAVVLTHQAMYRKMRTPT